MIIYLFEAIHLFFRSSAFNEASTLSLFVLSLKVLIVLVKVVCIHDEIKHITRFC